MIDRSSRRAWLDAGGQDAFARARVRADELVAGHRLPELDPSVRVALVARVREAGKPFGLSGPLPGVPGEITAD